LTGEPALHGLFFNSTFPAATMSRCPAFQAGSLPEPTREIVACGFFETAALPAETTRARACGSPK